MKTWAMVFLLIPNLTSCKKNPVDRLVNPVPEGAVPQSSGVFAIYDDELNTGGGLAFIPGGENQFIDLNDHSSPRRTTSQIRYIWNGADAGGQHLFAGFQLLVTPDGSTLASATGKDLSAPGYTKLTFYLRGNLSNGTRLRIEGPAVGTEPSDDNCSQVGCDESKTPTGDWQRVEVPISAARLSNVKIFATFSFQYTQPPRTTVPGEGGVIYLDDIHYER